MSKIIQTNHLEKKFKDYAAVNDVNICVERGDVYGFIGQNGAGKTTTIRLLLGLLNPTGGSIELFGEQVTKTNMRKFLPKIGAMIETPAFYNNLTGYENLDIHRIMMGVKDRERIKRVFQIVQLEDDRTKKVKDYSLGMRQRLGIARCLLHDPELLILDEPTNGLDPTGIVEIRDLIIDIAEKQGKTIMISSHILEEVEKMVNKIAIINKGNLLVEGNKDELIRSGEKKIVYNVDNVQKAIDIVRAHYNGEIEVNESHISLIMENENINSIIIKSLIEQGVNVYESKIAVASLENYFLEMIGKE